MTYDDDLTDLQTKSEGDGASDEAAIAKALEDLTKSVNDKNAKLEADLAAEKKAREALELKVSRPSVGAKGNASDDDTPDEKKALSSYMRSGNDTELKAAAATDSDPSGGYFVLPTVDTSVRTLLTDISPMRQIADVVTIGTDSLERFYSIGKRGAQWTSERGARPQDTARPELKKTIYGVSELYAAPVTTRQLLDDATVDIAAWLIDNATRDFAMTEGESFLSGNGVDNTPRGLLDYPTDAAKDFTREWGKFQYVPAGHASAPTDAQLADSLLKLMMTLRAPYRPNARWLMNRTSAIRIRQIRDEAGRFLWAPTGNLIEGEGDPLLGFPVAFDDSMPDIGANAHAVAFGDFRQGYVIVDRHGIRMERDAVTQKGRIVFDVYKRVGGGAGDFNAVKFLKIAAS